MGLNKIYRLILIAMLIPGQCKISAQYNEEILQNVRSANEKVFVQPDRRVYVTGDNIRYRVFLADASLNQPVNWSRILYLELSGLPEDKPVQWRINLHRGTASGAFPIPADLETGVYRLRAFTNFMRNGDPAYVFSNDLMIINISEGLPETIFIRNDSLSGVDLPVIEPTGYQPGIEQKSQGTGNNHPLQITGIKEQYLQNEEISFDLSVEGIGINDSVSLAVSVREVDPFNNLFVQPSIDRYFNLLSEIRDIPVGTARINDLNLFQKETHGFILNGDVTDSSGKPLAYTHLLLCVRDSISPNPIYIKTDAEGRFYAVLNEFYDNKEILLQVIDDRNNSDLIWEIEKANLPVQDLNTLAYNLTPDEITYVDRAKNIRIVEEIYNLPQPAIMDGHLPIIRNSFITPDYIIYPADFTELVNFKEIADNILPTARFITRNNQYNIEVFNRYLGRWFESRMIMLNGVLFKDLSYIATLGSRDILKIEIFNSNILCGDYTFPGLIAVYTRDGEIPETYLKNYTYSFANEVIPDDAAEMRVAPDAGQTNREFPDFRQTLYWNPDLHFSGTEHVKVEFESSRLKGEFEIIIQGITNGGEVISETFKFNVE